MLRTVSGVGIFSALAFITAFVCKPIVVGGFLSLDAKDAVIAIASFIYGPIVAPIISLISAFIEFISISETGWYGLVMNFASSTVFSLTASLIYKHKKSFNGAIIGFASAVALTTGVMLLLNIFVTPIYFQSLGIPMTGQDVLGMLPKILLPFNFAKSLLNSSLALLLYKPIIGAMRASRLVPRAEHKTEFNKVSLITLIVGGVSLLTALLVLLIIW